MNIVQIFHKAKNELKIFSGINQDHKNANVKSIFYYAVFFPFVELLNVTAVALIIWYGGGEVIRHSIQFGVLFAFIQFTEMFFRPVRDLSEKYDILQQAMASSERIFKLLDDNTFVLNPENPVLLTKIKGEIEFKNVWFAYNPGEYVIKNVSFNIHPGETIAIVGATGAGKTSLINILTRFYDIEKGSITIDGIDIKNFAKSDLRSFIGVVPQEPILFNNSIAYNIGYGRDNPEPNEIRAAAKLANISEFIESLPDKYETEVGERGVKLSGGQKQRLAIARMILSNPDIVIFDEATSHLDSESEKLIQNAFWKARADKTTIIIAHRLSTVMRADKIIVMDRGKITETGTHNSLLKQKDSLYSHFWNLQIKLD